MLHNTVLKALVMALLDLLAVVDCPNSWLDCSAMKLEVGRPPGYQPNLQSEQSAH